MRAVLQRVSEACVRVDGEVAGRIGPGLLILICAMAGDTETVAAKLATKIAKLRVFKDGQGKMNLSVRDIGGAALVLSPDTGPLHMTVALDRPVVSLIGYSNPKRVGPYRKFRDLMIDAYGEPDEDYPISMENRLDRLPRITVQMVLDKVERWRSADVRARRPISAL